MINKKIDPSRYRSVFIYLALFLVSNIFAVEVKKIEVHRFEDFKMGKLNNTVLDGQGRIMIGPKVYSIPGPEKEFYLSMDTGSNGDIFVGTGHQAAVYQIKPMVSSPASAAPEKDQQNIKLIFESNEDLDVYALLVSDVGNGKEKIFIGTSPEGRIYKVSKGEKKEFFNPDEKFIWDLKEDKTGNIICAVGNSGGIYKITPAGQAEKIFSPEDTHIVSLYINKENSIIAGSGDRGLLYQIDNRKVKVLVDTPFDEIRGICEDSEGNIYFSATKEITLSSQLKLKELKNSSPFSNLKKDDKKKRKILEKSVLYCLKPNGTAEKIWTSETDYIYSINYNSQTNSILVGTGDSGRLYSIKKDGSFSILYESDSAQIFKIVPKQKKARTGDQGFYILANNTPSIAEVNMSLNNKGVYYSDVFDLQIQSKLGHLYWDAEIVSQSSVTIFVRSGNSNVPDDTWTQWSAPFTNNENSLLNIPNCRYFQVKAVLTSNSTSETPALEGFKVFYLQSNLGPKLKKIEISKNLATSKGNHEQNDAKNSHESNGIQNNSSLTIRWEAEDLNKDKLKYNIYLKKVKSPHWIHFKKDLIGNKITLDPRLFQDGRYVVKVQADDSLSNPPSLIKIDKMESEPFLIDSTAPKINNFSIIGGSIGFVIEDETSIISNVWYSYDNKLWYPVFPMDMLNDSKSEKYKFNITGQESQKYIFIKVVDEFDNYNVFQKDF